MLNEIISELNKIADTESDDTEVGWRKRRKLVEKFINNRISVVKSEISVVNPESFNHEIMDLVKEKLCEQIAEDLTTETNYDINKNKIKAEMLVIKKRRT